MLSELNNFQDKRNALRDAFALCPTLANFYDLMMGRDESAWNNYAVFSIGSSIAFCSPEGHWNIYADSAQNLNYLLKGVLGEKGLTNLKAIFGPDQFDLSIVDRKAVDKDPYHLMTFDQSSDAGSVGDQTSNSIRIVEARECANAQDLVNEWYQSYNAEESRDWTPPLVEKLGKGRLFLFFNQENEFLGGVGNTLYSPDRFWIGRFYILPKFRRQGVASKAMRRLMTLARNEKKVFCLHVGGSNLRAQALYRKLGFRDYSPLVAWRF